MNSSPVTTWSEFDSRSTEAIFTFANQPLVVSGICLLATLVVGWFLVSAFRFDGHRDDAAATDPDVPGP